MLKITLEKSLIARKENQIKTAHALGLRKPHQTVVKEDNEIVRGMINTIKHLVSVEEA